MDELTKNPEPTLAHEGHPSRDTSWPKSRWLYESRRARLTIRRDYFACIYIIIFLLLLHAPSSRITDHSVGVTISRVAAGPIHQGTSDNAISSSIATDYSRWGHVSPPRWWFGQDLPRNIGGQRFLVPHSNLLGGSSKSRQGASTSNTSLMYATTSWVVGLVDATSLCAAVVPCLQRYFSAGESEEKILWRRPRRGSCPPEINNKDRSTKNETKLQ